MKLQLQIGCQVVKESKNQKGFTLVELLVVVAIIGILSAMTLVSLQGVRAKARDSQRKQHLVQIVKAVDLYYAENEHYQIHNSGWGSDAGNGCGCGWFSYEGGAYARSIARALYEDGGKIGAVIKDPTGGVTSSPTVGYSYMLYMCGNGFFVYAKLEQPSADDLATCNASTCCSGLAGYGMNYALGHK